MSGREECGIEKIQPLAIAPAGSIVGRKDVDVDRGIIQSFLDVGLLHSGRQGKGRMAVG
jgi:hypothetical protein